MVNGTGSAVGFAPMKPTCRHGRTGWAAPLEALIARVSPALLAPALLAPAILAVAVLGVAFAPEPLAAQSLEEAPQVFVGGVPFDLTMRGSSTEFSVYRVETAVGGPLADGQISPDSSHVIADLVVTSAADLPLVVLVGDRFYRVSAPFVPGWVSVLPPLVAVVLAVVFKDVVIALFGGVWVGALAIYGWRPILATLRTVDELVMGALAGSSGRAQIAVFSLLIGGMMGVVSRNGGVSGLVHAVSGWLTTRRRGKVAVSAAGVIVFFDDYASSVLAGTSMRPITDRLRISREKLAYVVNSAAVCAAAVVPFSTWVGYEIALIAEGLRIAAEEQQLVNFGVAAAASEASPLSVFLQTIPYRFYPLLTLWLVFLTSWTNRDLGPMAAAESRAAAGGGVYRPGAVLLGDPSAEAMSPRPGTKARWWNAVVPVIVAIKVALLGIYATGLTTAADEATLIEIVAAADPFAPLLWGSLAGCLVAVLLSVVQRALSVRESVEALAGGMRMMLLPVVILVLVWALGSVTETLGTAQFLSFVLAGRLPVPFLPALVFAVAAGMSFLIGTSWGTMAILLPISIPMTIAVAGWAGVGGDYTILLGVISSVLAGAVFGDHCSPISDTTVLSSAASGCDHMDHVRTQLPYALLVAVVAIFTGDVAAAFGVPPWISLAIGAAVLYVVLRWRGREVPERTEDEISDAPERTLEGDPRTTPLERHA